MVDNNLKCSVIITVRDEAENIAQLLESLLSQKAEKEIVVVDAESRDGTADIVRRYAEKHDEIRLIVKRSKRGMGRNIGIAHSTGDVVAFIDGDCIADENWLAEILESAKECPVVAGKTVYTGGDRFAGLERVELYRQGMDVTFPSSNLAYRREVIERIGGFDDWFITAEDIDLNIRAVDCNFKICYNEKAVVYHKVRETLYSFAKQAFWNGAGRKQLTLKYGVLWKNYRPVELLKRKHSFYGVLRVSVALMGYVAYKLFGTHPHKQVIIGGLHG
ncbi:MAG: glycosyltransferase [Methanomassiliicoccales archaeon]